MCDSSAIEFFAYFLEADEFKEKSVLEVGSLYVNGSVRTVVEKIARPSRYIGIDIKEGRFVDRVVPAEDLLKHFGSESFDAVISTELVEHVRDWRLVINNMKTALKEGGALFITTRSKGFKIHGYPHDYWRYELEDMKSIFSDFEIQATRPDPQFPGVFIRARKPSDWKPNDLSEMALYSVVLGRRTKRLPDLRDMPSLRRLWVKFFG